MRVKFHHKCDFYTPVTKIMTDVKLNGYSYPIYLLKFCHFFLYCITPNNAMIGFGRETPNCKPNLQ